MNRDYRACPLAIVASGPSMARNSYPMLVDQLLRRTSATLRRPTYSQVSRHSALSGSDRSYPAIPGSSGTQRARIRPAPSAPALVLVRRPSPPSD